MRSGSWAARTQKKHKPKVLQKAQQLAGTFLDLLKECDGKLFKAFANAGARLDMTNKAYDDMDV
eukprot:1567977-Prorocentrum_lima.AAC.1